MEASYGQGEFIEGDKKFKGEIILSDHKLFLKGSEGDLTATYIPTEKIIKVKKTFQGIAIDVWPSSATRYRTYLYGQRTAIGQLVEDLVSKLNLKKRFLRNEWCGDASWR